MLMFAAKIYNIPDLNDLLKTLIPNDVSVVWIPFFCCLHTHGLLAEMENIYSIFFCVQYLSKIYFSSNQVDPYLSIGDDLQLYVRPQVDVKEYGSFTDNQQAASILFDVRNKIYESDKLILDILVQNLSTIIEVQPLSMRISASSPILLFYSLLAKFVYAF